MPGSQPLQGRAIDKVVQVILGNLNVADCDQYENAQGSKRHHWLHLTARLLKHFFGIGRWDGMKVRLKVRDYYLCTVEVGLAPWTKSQSLWGLEVNANFLEVKMCERVWIGRKRSELISTRSPAPSVTLCSAIASHSN